MGTRPWNIRAVEDLLSSAHGTNRLDIAGNGARDTGDIAFLGNGRGETLSPHCYWPSLWGQWWREVVFTLARQPAPSPRHSHAVPHPRLCTPSPVALGPLPHRRRSSACIKRMPTRNPHGLGWHRDPRRRPGTPLRRGRRGRGPSPGRRFVGRRALFAIAHRRQTVPLPARFWPLRGCPQPWPLSKTMQIVGSVVRCPDRRGRA